MRMRLLVGGLAATGMILATGVVGTTSASAATSPRCGYTNNEPILNPWTNSSPTPEVQQLQCELNNSLNPNKYGTLDQDGLFGNATEQAVVNFQNCVHITPDGSVGPNTWYWLDHWTTSPWYGCN